MKSQKKQKILSQKSFFDSTMQKNISIEWKSIEMMDDFVTDSFFKPKRIYNANEHLPLDENGFPRSFTQFIA